MITLDEIKLQNALGVLGSDGDLYAELYHTSDLEVIKFIVIYTTYSTLHRAVASNLNTPYSILRHLYKYNPDYYVKEIAWDRIIQRYIRRFGSNVPPEYKRRPFISNLPA